eukprot:6175303-Pleurochrysis_carterae.AAC.1
MPYVSPSHGSRVPTLCASSGGRQQSSRLLVENGRASEALQRRHGCSASAETSPSSSTPSVA